MAKTLYGHAEKAGWLLVGSGLDMSIKNLRFHSWERLGTYTSARLGLKSLCDVIIGTIFSFHRMPLYYTSALSHKPGCERENSSGLAYA